MRVAVDAHAIGQRLTGNEVYVRSLIGRYPRLDSETEFITYIASREAVSWLPPSVRLRWVSKNPFLRLGGELSAKLRADRPDLVHVQYTAPLFCPVPIVVTIHDVSFMEYPEFLPAPRAFQLQISTRHTLRRAARIITISEFSRQHIARVFGVDPEVIAVTPLAAQESFRVMNRELAASLVRERLGIDRPYVLHVGDLHPRKNQIGLIRAFRELLAAHPSLPHLLVLAGKHTWFAPKVLDEVRRSGLQERIVIPGFVEDESLPALYNAADVFVFPSFYEGFGLPVVEAMACGRPIVCSGATALPEVVDGAGLFFDPHNVGDQTRALRDILVDPELSRRMERKSLQRAAFYNWRETARQTLDVYHQVVESRAGLQRRKELVAR
jgi:glycosyltransferase involved in cell wall biosynthesis